LVTTGVFVPGLLISSEHRQKSFYDQPEGIRPHSQRLDDTIALRVLE
jgi:hypothetical protein